MKLTEIDHNPLDTFTLVLFLLQDKHMMVEELLQLLVGKVDTQLLKGIELENFETGNIENTNEEITWEISS